MSPSTSSPASSSDHTSDSSTAPRTKRSRVSAEHTLNRVRENQRRHRARQRDHVASLERKLAETEKLLCEARQEIALLRQEAAERADYDLMQSGGTETSLLPTTAISTMTIVAGSPCLPLQQDSMSQSDYTDGTQMPPDLSFFTHDTSLSYYLPLSTSTSSSSNSSSSSSITTSIITTTTTTTTTSPPLPLPLPLPLLDPPTHGPPPCCSDTPLVASPSSLSTDTPSTPDDPECTSCKTRPRPAPTESTTLCAQAYVLIRQQNFRNLDPESIRLWLVQGLRRAQRQGEGCRVENGALLRLLDFISGV